MIDKISKITKHESQGKMSGFLKIILLTIFISVVSTASAGIIPDDGKVYLSDDIIWTIFLDPGNHEPIEVSPSSPTTLVVGGTQMFTATAIDQNNEPMKEIQLSWIVSNFSVGNVNPSNTITNVSGGATTTFSAQFAGTTTVNVTNGLVYKVFEVIVNNPLVVESGGPYSGTTNIPINFTGSASEGTPPYTYKWDFGDKETSSLQNPEHAYSSAGTYNVDLTVTDAAGITVKDSTQVTVNPPQLISNANGPYSGTTNIPINFTGSASEGTPPYTSYFWDFGDGETSNLQNPDHAYSSAGTYPANLTVTDTAGISAKDSTQVTVIPPILVLTTIIVSPEKVNLTVDGMQLFTATSKDQNGDPIEAIVTWSSSNHTVGKVDTDNGLFVAYAPGTTMVNAINGSVIGTAFVTVISEPPVLTSIDVTPNSKSLSVGDNEIFTAYPKDQYGAVLTAIVSWSSSNTTVGTVDSATGNFTAKSAGTTYITATNNSVSGNASVNVTAPTSTTPAPTPIPTPTLNMIIVSPPTSPIVVGGIHVFTAVTKDQNGNPINATVTWSSSNMTVGIINATGTFTAKAPGTAVVNATNGLVKGNASVTVVSIPPVLTFINVTPISKSLSVGENFTFNASPKDQNGNPINAAITWSSSNPAVGTFNISGTNDTFTAKATGTTTIKAESGSVNGTATVNVTAPTSTTPAPTPIPTPTLNTIIVSPPTSPIVVGGIHVFTAVTKDQNNNSINATITWSSSNMTVGIINATGTFTAKAPGTSMVNATNGLIKGTATVTVTGSTATIPAPAPTATIIAPTPTLKTIIVSLPTSPIAVGGTHQFTATKKDQNGNPINATVAWSSSNMTVGIINATGTFTAKASGSTMVNATNGLVKGTANVMVTKPKLAPSSNPNGTYKGIEGIPVSFNGSKSFDPDGSIITYFWDFGDGTNGTGMNPTHTYNQIGNYPVSLKVTDNDGLNASNSTTAKIEKSLIRITSPTNGQDFDTPSIEVSGTAISNASLNRVEVKVGSGPWENASGTSSWSTTVTLSEDTNTIYARANYTTRNSEEISITVTYTIPHNSGGGGTGTTFTSGGGGGGSGENPYNIELIEKYDLEISKDKTTSYWFRHLKNPIMYINITGNTNMGVITTSTELLKDTSTLVNNPPGGLVYKNVNIWVGTSGVATPRNIKEALIKFRVDNSWISSNGVKGSDIVLVKWNGTAWIQLETRELSRDDAYIYFQGKTNAFSPFVITTNVGGAKSSLTFTDQEVPIESGGITLDNNGMPIQPAQTPIITQTAPSGTSTWSIILIIFVIGIIVVAIYFVRVKK